MWNIFSSKPTKEHSTTRRVQHSEQVTLSIEGMHCSSCSMNIDGALEELPGVHAAQTSYAKAETKVEFDPEHTTVAQLQATIAELGYSASRKD